MSRHLSTRLLHPETAAATADAVGTPIVRTSTFRFESADALERYLSGEEPGFLYTRYENPTVQAVERAIAATENAPAAVLFSSGMAAATTCLLAHLKAGDTLLISESVYGGVLRFARDVLPRLGVKVRFVARAALTDDASYGERPPLVWCETPINPTLRLVDVAAVAETAHRHGAVLAVDATFASPVNQQTFTLGADLVMHSATKFLNGHTDLLAGALVGSEERLEPVRALQRALGNNLAPAEAWELQRGLKTLEVRVDRQNRTALELARRLEADPRVVRTLYPGLPSHPDHALARKQMRGFGGMVTFSLAGGLDAAKAFFDRLQLVERAASLGGVESLVSLPVLSSHHSVDDEQLTRAGIDRGMVRLSAGLEHVEDLWADLDQALGRTGDAA